MLKRRLRKDNILLERFCKEGGMDAFDEQDAIGLILDMARCPGDRQWTAYSLLREFGGLKGVLEAREEQLLKVDGVGKRTAILIRMIISFVRLWERVCMEHADRIGGVQTELPEKFRGKERKEMRASSSKQVIRGLESCRSERRYCVECPYSNMNFSICATTLRLDAIELIKKLEDEVYKYEGVDDHD